MASAVQDMNPTEKAWYSAVTSTLSHDLPTALVDIGLARDRMSDELGGFWAEDNAQPYPEYSPLFEPVNVRHSRTGRSYAAMVRTQLLAELEEAYAMLIFSRILLMNPEQRSLSVTLSGATSNPGTLVDQVQPITKRR